MNATDLTAAGNKLIELLISKGSDKFTAQNEVLTIIKHAPGQLLPTLAQFEKD